jgi:hypothetical protein
MAAGPEAELLRVPPEYGAPKAPLDWAGVRTRLEQATHYWLVTVRPDGRPHGVPVDGNWLDDRWYFGGSPAAVKHRNLMANPRAMVHLEDGTRAVIVEGVCEVIHPDERLATRLSETSKSKYGYSKSPSFYMEAGLWRLTPDRVLAWERFPSDATRFVFDSPD